jgi:hypothetical protein
MRLENVLKKTWMNIRRCLFSSTNNKYTYEISSWILTETTTRNEYIVDKREYHVCIHCRQMITFTHRSFLSDSIENRTTNRRVSLLKKKRTAVQIMIIDIDIHLIPVLRRIRYVFIRSMLCLVLTTIWSVNMDSSSESIENYFNY